jgi:hypothetical protein
MKLAELRVEEAQVTTVYGLNNRHLKDVRTQIDAVNNEIRDETQGIVDSTAADLNSPWCKFGYVRGKKSSV